MIKYIPFHIVHWWYILAWLQTMLMKQLEGSLLATAFPQLVRANLVTLITIPTELLIVVLLVITGCSFPSVLWHCWLGDRKGIWPVKMGDLACKNGWWFPVFLWWRQSDWSFESLIVVTTTSIILSSNKIQNGDILVPANPGPPAKMAERERGRDRETDRQTGRQTDRQRQLPVVGMYFSKWARKIEAL